jgi:hypothetical protein
MEVVCSAKCHIPEASAIEVNVCTLTNHDAMETQILSPHCIGSRAGLRVLIGADRPLNRRVSQVSCCRIPDGRGSVTAPLCSAKLAIARSVTALTLFRGQKVSVNRGGGDFALHDTQFYLRIHLKAGK